ncbi:hypothetical protein [Parahaliea mediterranea]|uniref:Uncharacterized protein n=1 Tax=Parahaliea mediterranea TaxID=651086 RepID=A0A939IN37_9GAMM|nr:hypothetical protein [Parahaliea mediterranea]MBN7797642.1 hypothetical protein [Parahaliea mediterranea]
MNAPAELKKLSVARRFNSFHLEVAMFSERIGWLLERLIKDEITDDGPDMELLHQVHGDLQTLIEAQDCRA